MAKQFEELLEAVQCSLCESPFQNPHTFGGCGHTFCKDCVLDTLEGPGIIKSQCPTCKQPGWKKDLVFNHQVNNVVGYVASLTNNLRRGLGLRQRMQSRQFLGEAGVQPGGWAGASDKGTEAAVVAALGCDLGGNAQQSVQPASLEEVPGERPTLAAAQTSQSSQPLAGTGMPEVQGQQGEGSWRAGQQTLEASALSSAAAGHVAAGQQAMPCFDEAWVKRMLALPDPSPALVERLLHEVALLDQAIRLCDELPCLDEPEQEQRQRQQLGSAGQGSQVAGVTQARRMDSGPGEERTGAGAGTAGRRLAHGVQQVVGAGGTQAEAKGGLNDELPQSLAPGLWQAEAGLSQELPVGLAAAQTTAALAALLAALPGSGGHSQELPTALAGQSPATMPPEAAAGDLPRHSSGRTWHQARPLAARKAASLLTVPDSEDAGPALLLGHRQPPAGEPAATPALHHQQGDQPRVCEAGASPAVMQGFSSPGRSRVGGGAGAASAQLQNGELAAAVIIDSPDAEHSAAGWGRLPVGTAEGSLPAVDLGQQVMGSQGLGGVDAFETRLSGRKRRRRQSGRATLITSAAQTTPAIAAAAGATAQVQTPTTAAADPRGALPLAKQHPSRLDLQQSGQEQQQVEREAAAQPSVAGPALDAAVEAIADSDADDADDLPVPAQRDAVQQAAANAAQPPAGSHSGAGGSRGLMSGKPPAPPTLLHPLAPAAAAAASAATPAAALPAWHKGGIKEPTWKRQKLEKDMMEAEKFVGGFMAHERGFQQQQQQPQQQQQAQHVVIGSLVRVLWEEGYFVGRVTKYRPATGEHFVVYKDGDRDWHRLEEEEWELLGSQQHPEEQGWQLPGADAHTFLPSNYEGSDLAGSRGTDEDMDSPLLRGSASSGHCRAAAQGGRGWEPQGAARPGHGRAQRQQEVVAIDSSSSDEEEGGGLDMGPQLAAAAAGAAQAAAQVTALAERPLQESEACAGGALQLGTEDAASLLAELAVDSSAATSPPGQLAAASKLGPAEGRGCSTRSPAGSRQAQPPLQPQQDPAVVQFKRRSKQPPAGPGGPAQAALQTTSRHNVHLSPGRQQPSPQLAPQLDAAAVAGPSSCQPALPEQPLGHLGFGSEECGEQGGRASEGEEQGVAGSGLKAPQQGPVECSASANKALEQQRQQHRQWGDEEPGQGATVGGEAGGSLSVAASAAGEDLTSVVDLFAAGGEDSSSKGPLAMSRGLSVGARQASPGGGSGPTKVLVPSYLSSQNQSHVLECIHRLRGVGKAVLEDNVSDRTTHVLVPTDDAGVAASRTIKYMAGLAQGCWVVSYAWLDACMEAGGWVSERAFEVRGDRSGLGAPMKARLERKAGKEGLFHGITAYVYNPASNNGASLAQLLELGGAKVLSRLPPSQDVKRVRIIIPGSVKDNKKTAQELKAKTGSKLVLSWEWVFDCLSRWRIMPHKPAYLY